MPRQTSFERDGTAVYNVYYMCMYYVKCSDNKQHCCFAYEFKKNYDDFCNLTIHVICKQKLDLKMNVQSLS